MMKHGTRNRRGRAVAAIVMVSIVAFATALVGCKNAIATEVESIKAEAVSPTVMLSMGSSVIAAGGTLDFGYVPRNYDNDIACSIKNSGKSDLVINVARIALTMVPSTAASAFSLLTPPSATVSPGASASFVLRFRTPDANQKKATLSIPTNDVNNPSFTISLTGTGNALSTPALDSVVPSGYTTLNLTWIAVTDATYYKVYRDNSSAFGNFTDKVFTTASADITYSDTTVAPGKTYYYKVQALNAAGGSAKSGVVQGTANGTAVSGITIVKATIGLTTGDTLDLGTGLTIAPGTASIKSVTWTSGNTSAATVNAAGLVTIVTAGTASITATSTDNSGVLGSYTVSSYIVGSAGPAGGIVFHIKAAYSSGWRFMEVAPSDASSGIIWCISSSLNSLAIAAGTAIGTGKDNTAAIISHEGTASSYAALVCKNSSLGGYSDWFLPSLGELTEVYNALKPIGLLTGFSTNYWSSTQSKAENPDKWACLGSFADGHFDYISGFVSPYIARAIREF